MKTKAIILLFLPILLLSSCSKSSSITFKTMDHELETSYDDSYFLLDNNVYHQELALVSIANAISTIRGGTDYKKKANNLLDLWKKEGFKDFYISDAFTSKPTTTSIGYGISNKHVTIKNEEFNLIAISVRSGEYEAEWASNVTLGSEGDAEGFDNASNEVKEGIYKYLTDHKITGRTKLWLNGFSRGAITANMTSAKILDDIVRDKFVEGVKTTSNDIYAYCFEPPAGALVSDEVARDTLYSCIHNVINMNDVVPMLAPYEWGFKHYGQDYYYPDRLTDIYFDATERYKIVSNYHFTKGAHDFMEYSIDNWKFFDPGQEYGDKFNLPRETLHPSLSRFFRSFIQELAKALQDRPTYASLVQNGLVEVFKAMNGLNEEIGDKIIDLSNIVDIFSTYTYVRNLILEVLQDNATGFYNDMRFLIYQIMGYNENNKEAISELVNSNMPLLVLFVQSFKTRKDLALQLFNRDNMLGIIIAHTMELCYTFLKSADTRFYGKKAVKLNDGNYKIIKISNPTSFTLYEHHLKKDIFTYKDKTMISDTLCAEKLANGDINIYIPNNGTYSYTGEFTSMALYNTSYKGIETVVNEALPPSGDIN